MMMNAYPQDSAQVLFAQLATYLSESTQVYALLDHSFDPRLLKKMRDRIVWTSLYQDHGAEADVSPLLCVLNSENEAELMEQIKLLLKITNGQPMLSFYLSTLDREAIFSHFDYYFDVSILPEKLSYILRYADTRILPNLLAQLSPEQKAAFLSPFSSVVYFDRAAQIIQLEGGGQTKITNQALVLTEVQFISMMDKALPDQILQNIQLLGLQSLLPIEPSKAYAQIRELCDIALAQGSSDDEILSFCVEHLHGEVG
ncbi:DUF4123 domain-containing protein [Iodobacter sp. LRB]|uniref:DUF4123 domain-containing protein n=1 Tax=unclassified Iodobacter TaxID=235634 RepID=UPI000C0E61DB|nr:DUF4123 domain-containing protein [Iodobacter sp. BJB302]PHU99529.1 hypothetical protein CSQ88_22040 [Iodobacter sp. BJB302]